MEIDYEKSSNPNLTGLQAVCERLPLGQPYDATGNNFAARLTIDLGNNDQYLDRDCELCCAQLAGRLAVRCWTMANAMVATQKTSISTLETGWGSTLTAPAQCSDGFPPNSQEACGWLEVSPNCATLTVRLSMLRLIRETLPQRALAYVGPC